MNSAILVSLLAATVVTLVTGCCTPDQWEGYQGSLGGYASHHGPGLIQEMKKISYDFTNKKAASFLTYVNRGHETKFQMVVRYAGKVGTLYFVNLNSGKCKTIKLKKPFKKGCIPADAKHFGDYYMGLKGGFKVSGYGFKKDEMTGFASVQVLKDSTCVPVTESVYGRVKDVFFLDGIGFSNVTPGISNSSIFDIPKSCQKFDVDEHIEEYLNTRHQQSDFVFGL